MKRTMWSKTEIAFILIIILVIVGIFVMLNRQPKVSSYAKNLFYMDTYINVKIYEDNKKILDEVDKLYKSYHELTDRYTAYEGVVNVYYLNNTLKINEQIKIDSRLYSLIKYGIDYNKVTDGYVNIALGNVIDVWKQYRDGVEAGIPTIEELRTSGSININDIRLSDDSYTKTSDVKIDLGCIAKGYVTQLAGELLEKNGITNYIINAGGNVKNGAKPDSSYNIGIQDPFDKNEIFTKVHVNDKSVVTSGGYERFYTYNNVKYHHIVDPYTLFPPVNDIASVTIITKDSAYADMMSTYLFVIGYEKGLEYVRIHPEIDVIWYMNDKTIHCTAGAENYAKE